MLSDCVINLHFLEGGGHFFVSLNFFVKGYIFLFFGLHSVGFEPQGPQAPQLGPFQQKEKKSSDTCMILVPEIINSLELTIQGFCGNGRRRSE